MQDSFIPAEQLRLEGTSGSPSCQTLTSLVSLKHQKIKLIHGSKNGLHLDSRCMIYWQYWLLSFLIAFWSMIKQLIKGLHDNKLHSGTGIWQCWAGRRKAVSFYFCFLEVLKQCICESEFSISYGTSFIPTEQHCCWGILFYFNFLPLVDHMPTSKLIIRGPDFFLF